MGGMVEYEGIGEKLGNFPPQPRSNGGHGRKVAVDTRRLDMSRKVLNPGTVMEIKRLYAETDRLGRGLHTQRAIAEMLGIGETTVFRALSKAGAYQGVRDLPTSEEAADVLARVVADIEVQKVLQRQSDTLVEELKGERIVPDAGY
jgi:predicted transcriptional regulator